MNFTIHIPVWFVTHAVTFVLGGCAGALAVMWASTPRFPW